MDKETDLIGSQHTIQDLVLDDFYKLSDLYFLQKNIMYTHLYNSYDKFIDVDIMTLLKNDSNNIFFERVTNSKIYKYKFVYDNIAIKPAILETGEDDLMYPHQARTKSMSYSSKLVATIYQVQETIDIATDQISTRVIGPPEHEYPIAVLPIMVRSKYCSLNLNKNSDKHECEFDPGGYFIINGSEKVVMALEKMIENKPLVFTKKDANSIIYTCQVNSKNYLTDQMQVTTIRMKKDDIITIKIPILDEVPVFILMRALGIESDKDIINYVIYDKNDLDMINLVRIAIENSKPKNSNIKITTRNEAINYLITRMKIVKKYNETDKDIRMQEKKLHLITLLKDSVLPHVEGDVINKGYYIGYMLNRLLQCYLGRIPIDDRDSFINKRIDLPGALLFELFKQFYKKMLNECNKMFRKRGGEDDNPQPIINQIKPNIIEQGLRTALLTGVWANKKGVAQMLQRLSTVQTYSSLRRLNSPTVDASTNKLTSPRHLNATGLLSLCHIETPEGHKVGLVKNLSLIGNITVMMADQIYLIKSKIKDKILNISDVPADGLKNYTRVFLNGEWLGLTNHPRELYLYLKKMKYTGEIETHTSIIHEIKSELECKEIKIYCDGGRLYHPILRVENNELLLNKNMINSISRDIKSWNEFMAKNPGVVEFIDTDEVYNSMISILPSDIIKMKERMKKVPEKMELGGNKMMLNRYDDFTYLKYTHCSIHPSLHLGVVSSNIPYCNHNQGPRNIFQYSQARQAMGIYVSNYRDRADISYILYHSQRPLITTRASKYIYTDELPAGENAVVAIMVYTGYNQEDSVLENQTAIDRGFMRSTSLKKYNTTIQKNQSTSQDDMFAKPDPSKVTGMRHGSYDKLNEYGHVPEETEIVNGDIIIGKVSPIQPSGGSTKTFKDNSETYKSQRPGVVDRVWSNIYNVEGYEMKKMRVRSMCIPHIGDKFCMTEDHDVLTDQGWIPIRQVTLNHKVAVLENNQNLKYEHPLDLIELDYNDKLYEIQTQQVDLKVTLYHKMYVKLRDRTDFELIEASKIVGKRINYKKDAINTNPDIDIFTLENHNLDMNKWIKLFGLWIAENTVEKIVFSKSVKSELQQSIIDLGLTFTEVNNKIIISDNISQYLNTNMNFPEWVWNLSQSQCQSLIGYITSNMNRCVYYSGSLDLLNNFQKLCIHAGWSGNIDLISSAGQGFSPIDVYGVNIVKENNTPLVVNPQLERLVDYNGKVYCLEVPNNIFMVRRNGKPVWTGNCARHGQKGTLGITLPASDMPFTKDGIQPDIIINTHAIPSRMTVGQLIECLVGKVSAIRGHETDGTPFNKPNIEAYKDILESLGYERNGYEYLYNGMTGEKLMAQIFIGPTYYQRLKHMVSDKIHSRATGPRTVLTHQPPEGRSRDGGLRFGEMERDCIISHGLARFLKERLVETADVYVCYTCAECGLFAQRMLRRDNKEYSTANDTYWCPACKNKTNINKIKIPYAFKLLLQELMSMSIAPRIRVKNNAFDS